MIFDVRLPWLKQFKRFWHTGCTGINLISMPMYASRHSNSVFVPRRKGTVEVFEVGSVAAPDVDIDNPKFVPVETWQLWCTSSKRSLDTSQRIDIISVGRCRIFKFFNFTPHDGVWQITVQSFRGVVHPSTTLGLWDGACNELLSWFFTTIAMGWYAGDRAKYLGFGHEPQQSGLYQETWKQNEMETWEKMVIIFNYITCNYIYM